MFHSILSRNYGEIKCYRCQEIEHKSNVCPRRREEIFCDGEMKQHDQKRNTEEDSQPEEAKIGHFPMRALDCLVC